MQIREKTWNLSNIFLTFHHFIQNIRLNSYELCVSNMHCSTGCNLSKVSIDRATWIWTMHYKYSRNTIYILMTLQTILLMLPTSRNMQFWGIQQLTGTKPACSDWIIWEASADASCKYECIKLVIKNKMKRIRHRYKNIHISSHMSKIYKKSNSFQVSSLHFFAG